MKVKLNYPTPGSKAARAQRRKHFADLLAKYPQAKNIHEAALLDIQKMREQIRSS